MTKRILLELTMALGLIILTGIVWENELIRQSDDQLITTKDKPLTRDYEIKYAKHYLSVNSGTDRHNTLYL